MIFSQAKAPEMSFVARAASDNHYAKAHQHRRLPCQIKPVRSGVRTPFPT
ncbi:conserved hypothetical protein [Cupriavidus taiwanensis]|uniref:Uncharacterized protein n=1 Tax=Cupriavidus taiwanensis TaxID=164546 RepID=A0A375J5N3_9BURK|nr:conserved hypothetical protein [Cupriavidus taiwanensis]